MSWLVALKTLGRLVGAMIAGVCALLVFDENWRNRGLVVGGLTG